jgi:uncharacterized protein (DUF1778 family)
MKKEPKRSFIGISCKPEIRQDIVKAAKLEHRTVSNFLVQCYLEWKAR